MITIIIVIVYIYYHFDDYYYLKQDVDFAMLVLRGLISPVFIIITILIITCNRILTLPCLFSGSP